MRRAEEQAAIQLSRDMQRQQRQQQQQNGQNEEEDQEEMGLQEQEELGHMQLVLKEGLWIGDVYAAQDEKSLQEAGIVSIIALDVSLA